MVIYKWVGLMMKVDFREAGPVSAPCLPAVEPHRVHGDGAGLCPCIYKPLLRAWCSIGLLHGISFLQRSFKHKHNNACSNHSINNNSWSWTSRRKSHRWIAQWRPPARWSRSTSPCRPGHQGSSPCNRGVLFCMTIAPIKDTISFLV